MHIESENYTGLFKMQGRLTCLHSEFLVTGSLGLSEAIVVCRGDDWRSFMDKDGGELCSQKGYEIFSDEALYQKYKSDFEEYIGMARKDIIPRFNKKSVKISLEDFLQILPILGKFWYFYGITEFPYHDFAHSKGIETNNKTLIGNLDDLAKLKFEGRELLNAYVFENGVLHNVLNNIGEQFLEEKNKCHFSI